MTSEPTTTVRRNYAVRAVEAAWREAWDRAGCHVAEKTPTREPYFVHDATPFPNGPLHMGHVRCYVLGDLIARYQRLRGRSVLYHTGFDSFGLPIELAAAERGVSPRRLVRRAIARQTRQLRRLGISYDWTRVADTSEPSTYRWTQWLFLELWRAGLVEHRLAPIDWCPGCDTALSRLQVEDGRCWRCETAVETRRVLQWTVLTSRYVPRLRSTLADLDGWSPHARRALAGLLDDAAAEGSRGQGGADWVVSRRRSWGTPIPAVHCDRCGAVPVPDDRLPVVLPDELDWASGSGALARCDAFVRTRCPRCGDGARRETDTLDCSFDDVWCYLQTHVLGSEPQGFTRENLSRWLPVDRSQSGRDTYPWFHLYRFLGAFLHDRGLLDAPDFIRGFFGHDMVLAGRRKMSKHLGNAVDPDAILESHGADALRVAMLWAAGPQRAVVWSPDLLDRATRFLDDVYGLFESLAPLRADGDSAVPSRKAKSVAEAGRRTAARVGGFIDGYRPNAAIEELARLARGIGRFAQGRLAGGRLDAADTRAVQGALDDLAVALAPFAPHLAEEAWKLRGHETLVAQASWPESG